MFRKFLSLIAVLSSTALLFSNSALADISIMVENAEPVLAGQMVDVEVIASGDETITGFQLPKDYAEAGFGSTGLSFIGFTAGPDFASTTSTAAPSSIFNFDRSFSDLQIGGGANLNLGDSLLYTMHFMVDAGAAPGTIFPVFIQSNPTIGGVPQTGLYSVSGPAGDATGNVTLFDGSVTVAGIPEPGSIAVLALGVGGLILRRRPRTA